MSVRAVSNKLERMDRFFAARLDECDEHMLCNIEELPEAYERVAQLVPATTRVLLDLGCGTGLELRWIFKACPSIRVVGIDLTQAMLDELHRKYVGRDITLICADYLRYDLGEAEYDDAVSFETMHHLTHSEKRGLYVNICKALKPGSRYIECDYMVDTQDEENQWAAESCRIRAAQGVPVGEPYHYDTPLTIKNQVELLLQAGFTSAEEVWRKNGTAIIVAEKGRT